MKNNLTKALFLSFAMISSAVYAGGPKLGQKDLFKILAGHGKIHKNHKDFTIIGGRDHNEDPDLMLQRIHDVHGPFVPSDDYNGVYYYDIEFPSRDDLEEGPYHWRFELKEKEGNEEDHS
jgi:hypothetical protein